MPPPHSPGRGTPGRVVNEREVSVRAGREPLASMRSLLNRLFDLDRLAAELACENFQVLRLREDVHFLAVGTASGQVRLAC